MVSCEIGDCPCETFCEHWRVCRESPRRPGETDREWLRRTLPNVGSAARWEAKERLRMRMEVRAGPAWTFEEAVRALRRRAVVTGRKVVAVDEFRVKPTPYVPSYTTLRRLGVDAVFKAAGLKRARDDS